MLELPKRPGKTQPGEVPRYHASDFGRRPIGRVIKESK